MELMYLLHSLFATGTSWSCCPHHVLSIKHETDNKSLKLEDDHVTTNMGRNCLHSEEHQVNFWFQQQTFILYCIV